MEVQFDSEKDRINRHKHGISLAAAQEMDFDTARIRKDKRRALLAIVCTCWRSPCADKR
jgi:uncharacterized DUF497 family protein